MIDLHLSGSGGGSDIIVIRWEKQTLTQLDEFRYNDGLKDKL